MPNEWKQALDNLVNAAEGPPMHSEWCGTQSKIIKDFIDTTYAYIKQLEEDYDDIVHVHVR